MTSSQQEDQQHFCDLQRQRRVDSIYVSIQVVFTIC